MSIYLLTVRDTAVVKDGLRLYPGIKPSQSRLIPQIGQMRQGARLVLRRPDGSVLETELLTYGITVHEGDGFFYTHDDPKDPEVLLTVPATISSADVPAGTTVELASE